MSLPKIKYTMSVNGGFHCLMAVAVYDNADDLEPGDSEEFADLVQAELLKTHPKTWGWRMEPTMEAQTDAITYLRRLKLIARGVASIEKAAEGWMPDKLSFQRRVGGYSRLADSLIVEGQLKIGKVES